MEDRPADAPVTSGPWKSDFKIVGNPTFTEAAAALSSLVFAYAGTPAFFSIVSEMRDPRKYTRSLVICQSVVTLTYLVIGIVVYYYCGSYVASPALGSAGITMKRICYGLALPGLTVSMVLFTHVSTTYSVFSLLMHTDFRIAVCKIHLYSPDEGHSTSGLKHHGPLDRVGQLHFGHCNRFLRRRKRHPSIRWPRLAYGSSLRNPAIVPADGMHVAVRQLGRRESEEKYQMEADGLLECLCDRIWYILDDCWHLRFRRGDHGQLQGDWWLGGMVLRR